MSDAGASLTAGNLPKSSDCQAVDRFWLTPAEALINPPPPPPCECGSPSECTGNPGSGTWTCIFCQCLLLNSPLVLHLPDYLMTGSNPRWWGDSFCGLGAPTVCLDWWGDGQVSCNSWPKPGSGVAFVVVLSADDSLALSGGVAVPAEPWRHFFGNVTMGPDGDFPFEHGFDALSAHCGVDPGERGLIDFAECQQLLHVWHDWSGDGYLDPGEVLELTDLDIETLSGIRLTDKRDSCGNLFPFESHATCNGRDGRCGVWLDVFFEPRY